jgi:uncharacterized membrane protein
MLEAVQILVFLGAPALVLLACVQSKLLTALSPVVLCYAFGIVWGNALPVAWRGSDSTTEMVAGLGVILALTALLASTDFGRWLKQAPMTTLGASLAIVASVAVTVVAATMSYPYIPGVWKISGMLVGVYTGGTINLAAIAHALEVDPVTWGVVHTSDVIVTGIWYLVLLMVGPKLYGWVLRTDRPGPNHFEKTVEGSAYPVRTFNIIRSSLLTLLIAAPALGLGQLATWWSSALEGPVSMVAATTFAIVASFVPRIRSLPGLSFVGDYLLLVFCVAVGTLATWDRMAHADPTLLIFTAIVVLLAVAVHLLLSRVFGVDRDTALITSVAALYGPPFVPAIARTLRNQEALVSGVTSGLLGLAIGNYLGLGVAYGLR